MPTCHDFFLPQKWTAIHAKGMGFDRIVNTTNGVESLHHSLKEFHLRKKGVGTVSSLVEVIVTSFIPSLIDTYKMNNYRASSQYRSYNQLLPKFMHDRPRPLVEHLVKRQQRSQDYERSDVIRPPNPTGAFAVKSQTQDQFYIVSFGSPSQMPECSCYDFFHHFLPCKHFFAVFHHSQFSWFDLPPQYLESPYLTLDYDILSCVLAPLPFPITSSTVASPTATPDPSSIPTATPASTPLVLQASPPEGSLPPPVPPESLPIDPQSPSARLVTPSARLVTPSARLVTPLPLSSQSQSTLEKRRRCITQMVKKLEDRLYLVEDVAILAEIEERLQTTMSVLPAARFQQHTQQDKTARLRRRSLPVKRKRGRTSGHGKYNKIDYLQPISNLGERQVKIS